VTLTRHKCSVVGIFSFHFSGFFGGTRGDLAIDDNWHQRSATAGVQIPNAVMRFT
jgi:hypothetical protein